MIVSTKKRQTIFSIPKNIHKLHKKKLTNPLLASHKELKDLDITEKDHGISAIMKKNNIGLEKRKMFSLRNLEGLQIPNLKSNKNLVDAKSKKKSVTLKIGFKIFSLNLERVFFIVIIILVTTPFFYVSTFLPKNRHIKSGVILLGELVNRQKEITPEFLDIVSEIDKNEKIIVSHRKNISYIKIYKTLKIINENEKIDSSNSESFYESGDINKISKIRNYSLIVQTNIGKGHQIPADFFVVCIFVNNEYEDDINSCLSILNTIFIIIIFSVVVRQFRLDTVKLLVRPIRKMKKMVDYIKKDPIRANHIINYYFVSEIFDSKK